MAVYKLKNKIQNYVWGSETAMSELLGYENPTGEPMAELWMGAHPKSSSLIEYENGESAALNEVITAKPEEILGNGVSKRYGGRLPYLFKVLAADSPLSIQAHPNLKQAKEGFYRENEAGIALDAFNRNYKDDNHKPEIICALTEYHTMRGFRAAASIAANFRQVMIPELEAVVESLEAVSASPMGGNAGSSDAAVTAVLKTFFTELMQLPEEPRGRLIEKAVTMAKGQDELPASRWILRFAELYPGDIGIVSPLYLNIVVLKPGDAMYLPAGELHAYLEGLGMELMANSDNVLRGGLTPKHVDLPELLSTLSFSPVRPEILKAVRISGNESAYQTEAPEFYLSRIELKGGEYRLPEESYGPQNPSIFICLEGEGELSDDTDGSVVTIARGESAFATFSSRLVLKGRGLIYRAAVPDSE